MSSNTSVSIVNKSSNANLDHFIEFVAPTSDVKTKVASLLKIRVSSCWEVADVNGDLALVKLSDQCTNEEIDEFGRYHGIIVDTSNGVIPIFTYGMPKVQIFTRDTEISDNCELTPVYGSVMVTMFRYKGKTYHSTHSKIEYAKSRWVVTRKFSEMYSSDNGPTDDEYFQSDADNSTTCYKVIIVDPELQVASRQCHTTKVYLFGQYTVNIPESCGSSRPGILPPGRLPSVPKFTKEEAIQYCIGKGDGKFDEGEAFCASQVTDSTVRSFTRYVSASYLFREQLRNCNPNVINRLYDIIDTPHSDPMFQNVDTEVLKKACGVNVPKLTSDSNLKKINHQLVAGYLFIWSLPEHRRQHVLEEFAKLNVNRVKVCDWLIAYSRTPNMKDPKTNALIITDEITERGLKLILDARKYAALNVNNGRATYFQLFKERLHFYLSNEFGPSLYKLVKKMNN